jgi:hypothetical protein
MDEHWLERWPVVVAATRVAIETATRQLTAVVSEMQQQNGELRQRTSHLDLKNEELRRSWSMS